MPGGTLTDADILDLLTTTLDELNRGEFSDIAQELQDYPVMRNWLRKERVVVDSGAGWQYTIMRRTGGYAKMVGLFEEDNTSYVSLLTTMSVDWVQAQTAWIVERRMLLKNRGAALINNVVEPQRRGALIDMADILETQGWTLRDVNDLKSANGIPYYVVKSQTAGFNGGLPAGHSLVANVNLTTTPNYKNYTDGYTNVSKTDLIKKWRTAYKKTGFKSPITMGDFRGAMGRRYRYYMNESTQTDIETLAELQNNQLGPDVAEMDGQTVFKKIPIEYVPFLDSDTTNPLYGIAHETFYAIVLEGDYLRESDPTKAANRHNVFETFVDLSFNFVCTNRRKNFVISKAA
jgi:hypothetical protein